MLKLMARKLYKQSVAHLVRGGGDLRLRLGARLWRENKIM